MAQTSRARVALTAAAVAVAVVAFLVLRGPRAKEGKGPTPAASGSAASGPKRARPKIRTTSAPIYLANLDAEIDELERLLRERPATDPGAASTVLLLSSARHTRGRYRGDVHEIQAGIDGASRCARIDPTNAACLLARAAQQQSLHRFPEARADLAQAKALKGDPSLIRDLETELDWNDGRYDVAIPAIRDARRRRPSSATWMREAQLEHDLGREVEADAAFATAESLLQDTSPLAVAHFEVQRGVQRSDVGQLEEAIRFFRSAAERMPDYVSANEHLAEALAELGQDEEATRIYERVVRISDDPEFSHALGELYAGAGRADEARDMETKAKRGYDELLSKFPEAMMWHASEFYVAIGDFPRALSLLKRNLVLRPNARSLVALARVELASGHVDEAKATIDKALAMPLVSADLFWTASQIARRSGDAGATARHRARAIAINPRIVEEENEEETKKVKDAR